jgi:hypothetical protein
MLDLGTAPRYINKATLLAVACGGSLKTGNKEERRKRQRKLQKRRDS